SGSRDDRVRVSHAALVSTLDEASGNGSVRRLNRWTSAAGGGDGTGALGVLGTRSGRVLDPCRTLRKVDSGCARFQRPLQIAQWQLIDLVDDPREGARR